MKIEAKDLFSIGADPVDITAARLLFRAPWWTKPIETLEPVPIQETKRFEQDKAGLICRHCGEPNRFPICERCRQLWLGDTKPWRALNSREKTQRRREWKQRKRRV